MKSMKPEIELFLDSTHDAMIAIDDAMNISIFNKAAEQLTGIDARRAMGQPVEEIIDNTRLPHVKNSGVAELNRRQMLGDIEIITNRMPVYNEAGVIIGAIAVFRDVSELVRLTDELIGVRSSLERLQSLFDALQDAISVVDQDGQLLLINESYRKMSGLQEEDLHHEANGLLEADLHQRVLISGEIIRGVNKYIPDQDRHVLIDCSPLLINGRIEGSTAVIRDFSEIRRLTSDLSQAKSIIRNLDAKYTFEDIIGHHPKMLEAIEKAKLAARTNATLLLRGQSGTGKELLAHAIHNDSERKFRPFIRVNCAAIHSNLMESELFGYAEGSFTGARRGGHKGYFETASGGTIFLDEIAEIDLNTQAKLLRVLQEKEIQPVGSAKTISVDVRIISATNANLEELVEKGKFREDLYYRLNVFPIFIPTLAERKEDIPALARVLMRKLNREYGRIANEIDPEAMMELMQYSWPGNVRELENIIARAMINLKLNEPVIRSAHLPQLTHLGRLSESLHLENDTEMLKLKDFIAIKERDYILGILKKNRNNKTKTAKELGISIRSLYNKIGG